MKWYIVITLTSVVLSFSLGAYCESADDLFLRARELYSEGPKKAPEMIDLLTSAVESNPRHYGSISLLAIVNLGIGNDEDALRWANIAIEIDEDNKKINAGILMLKARALSHLGKTLESCKILNSFSAFWAGSKKLEELYNYYVQQCRS